MRIEFTKEQVSLREELRKYLKNLMNSKLKEELKKGAREGGGPEFRKTLEKIGSDGWIGLSWPKEYGGQEATPLEQYIFTEEILRSGFPYPFLTTDSIGPTIAEFGSKELKKNLIPDILSGKIIFAIGYSEANSGTDLASLSTTAQLQNKSWIINGQKMWTSLADYSDYIWLAVRTDPKTSDHKGLSILVVPNASTGLSITPILTLGGVRTNSTFFDNVKVPKTNLVGEINRGWNLITGQLNRERLSLVNNAPIEKLLEDVIKWAKNKKGVDEKRLIDEKWVQKNLAKVKAGAEALKLLCWKQAWQMTEKKMKMEDASVAKVYGSEFFIEAYRLLMEVLGQESILTQNSSRNLLEGRLEMLYRISSILTFGGGTNEIQRDIIAMIGLGMPRENR
ncbi:MAG: acyl-CoA dehydrogenase [Gammaproteobacteria bacterium]|nr:acyl-CoA dehydrogenase [Gammaproteobacteria bacterium]|tara:strand:- start:1910 stop:3091 length:1182 start_codon:yes stop_codon:yes gene_type:complete